MVSKTKYTGYIYILDNQRWNIFFFKHYFEKLYLKMLVDFFKSMIL